MHWVDWLIRWIGLIDWIRCIGLIDWVRWIEWIGRIGIGSIYVLIVESFGNRRELDISRSYNRWVDTNVFGDT